MLSLRKPLNQVAVFSWKCWQNSLLLKEVDQFSNWKILTTFTVRKNILQSHMLVWLCINGKAFNVLFLIDGPRFGVVLYNTSTQLLINAYKLSFKSLFRQMRWRVIELGACVVVYLIYHSSLTCIVRLNVLLIVKMKLQSSPHQHIYSIVVLRSFSFLLSVNYYEARKAAQEDVIYNLSAFSILTFAHSHVH